MNKEFLTWYKHKSSLLFSCFLLLKIEFKNNVLVCVILRKGNSIIHPEKSLLWLLSFYSIPLSEASTWIILKTQLFPSPPDHFLSPIDNLQNVPSCWNESPDGTKTFGPLLTIAGTSHPVPAGSTRVLRPRDNSKLWASRIWLIHGGTSLKLIIWSSFWYFFKHLFNGSCTGVFRQCLLLIFFKFSLEGMKPVGFWQVCKWHRSGNYRN